MQILISLQHFDGSIFEAVISPFNLEYFIEMEMKGERDMFYCQES